MEESKLSAAWGWLVKHRRKVLSAAIVALPFVARVVPAFPSAEIVSVLRAFLGA